MATSDVKWYGKYIAEDSAHRLVTDEQIEKWNSSGKYIVITDNSIDFDTLAEGKYIYTVQYENDSLKTGQFTQSKSAKSSGSTSLSYKNNIAEKLTNIFESTSSGYITIIVKGQGDDSLVYIDAYEKDNNDKCTRVHHLNFSPIETYPDTSNNTADYRCLMPELYNEVSSNIINTDVLENIHEHGDSMKFSVYSVDSNGSRNSNMTNTLVSKDGVTITGTDADGNNTVTFDLNTQYRNINATFQSKDEDSIPCYLTIDGNTPESASITFNTGLSVPGNNVKFSYSANSLFAKTNAMTLTGILKTVDYLPASINITNMNSGVATAELNNVIVCPGSNASVILPFDKYIYSLTDIYYGCNMYCKLRKLNSHSTTEQEIVDAITAVYDTWNTCEVMIEHTATDHFIIQTITITGLLDSDDNIIQLNTLLKFVRQGYYGDDRINDVLISKAQAHTQTTSGDIFINNITWGDLKLVKYIL